MAVSFISEHSAEYAIVPSMMGLLGNRFTHVVPIFPWLSREFGNRSKSIHGFSGFKVLALFPRRPKISEQGKIFVTVNSELTIFKELGLQHGISVLAGCPKAASFLELASCECVWLDIDYSYEYLTNIETLDKGKRLSDEEVITSVANGNTHSMESLEEFIRETRYVLPAGYFGMRYKPIYFLAL